MVNVNPFLTPDDAIKLAPIISKEDFQKYLNSSDVDSAYFERVKERGRQQAQKREEAALNFILGKTDVH